MHTQLAMIEDPIQSLFGVLERSVSSLQSIIKALRSERECVAFFDVQGLMGALESKNQALAEHQELQSQLSHHVKSCWQESGPRRMDTPENVSEALRLLGESVSGQSGRRLVEYSSELVALIDVVRELHDMNKELVQRSVSWITSYVAELVDTSSAGTYDVTGRIGRQRNSAQLVKRLI